MKPYLQVAVTIAYTYGWRTQSEVLPLTLAQVGVAAGTLRLDPGTTKNGEGRLVHLAPELPIMLIEQIDRVKGLSRKLNRVVPFLFPNPRKGLLPWRTTSEFQESLANCL